ncbi:hypothetical protein M3P36_12470 [Altererythrobacter sp. KTW20L]|uniref:hypothetical protein n=1 Tax=Altererythrobacter sp. KTW20L TaxID=2942210 RepID=UPI0020BDFFCF|nr:hypothetical protein [Altererythrobacter sp. KTW20L]MCL6251852.1 hypothetical protein [Altererythrobacter sp. KTW20L]
MPIDFASDSDIRQGDVLRSFSDAGRDTDYGIVITADCDIAQKKSNNRITIVRAVPADHFVSHYWSVWELEKIAERQIRSLIPFVNGAIRRTELALDQLTAVGLRSWVISRSPEEIFRILDIRVDKYNKEYSSLVALSQWLSFANDVEKKDGFKCLKSVSQSLGRPESELRERVREALLTSGGFQDYLIVPNLPQSSHDGMAVLMGELVTVPVAEVHGSAYAARVCDADSGYVRFGRLADRVRFAIAQRISFVFSRIGMEENYEDDCRILADLVSSEVANAQN